jgi:ABC-type transport system involved in multi-copper enzyme maturation permease subunit
MIRALFLRNLRQHAVLLGVLFSSLVLLEFFLVWVAAQMDLGPEFQRLLEAILPPEVTEMIFSQFGVSSFEGAVAFGYQHPFSLVACIAMVMVAASLPAAERERGLLDLFLARPVRRYQYLLAIFLFLLLSAVLLPSALLLGTALGLGFVDGPAEIAWIRYIPSVWSLVLLLVSLGSLSFLFATGARRRGIAVAQGVGLTLFFYWLDFMGEYWETLQTARKFSPFFYFDPGRAAVGPGLTLTEFLVLGSIAAVAGLAAFFNFQRQDL